MVKETTNSMRQIININILNPNLSIKYPHINLVEPFTRPNKIPIEYKASCPTFFLLPKILLVLEIKKQMTIIIKYINDNIYLHGLQKQNKKRKKFFSENNPSHRILK